MLPISKLRSLIPVDIYNHYLKTIGLISFTRREIDIISCLLSGRAAKTIAFFLKISPRTIETHMRNIMLKIGNSSREGIIDFIEKSGKFSIIRKHYQNLLLEAGFERKLKEVASLIKAENHDCILAYEQDDDALFLSYIAKHLQIAGIQSKMMNINAQGFSIKSNFQNAKSIICAVPEAPKSLLDSLSMYCLPQKLFLISSLEEASLFSKEEYIVFSEHENYYLLTFEILKKLLLQTNIEKIFSEFKVDYDTIMQSLTDNILPLALQGEGNITTEVTSKNLSHNLKKWKIWAAAGMLGCLSFAILGVLLGAGNKPLPGENLEEYSLKSDFLVPIGKSFLPRPNLIKQIEDSFKISHDIQTVVLLGIGGSGKTTLARQYARIQKSSIIWEINAETRESLLNSFEDFANALCKAPEEKDRLKEIKALKNFKEKEGQIISFVKDKLKTVNGWFLVFDNVEKMGDIQHYFPTNSASWGKGGVLITSRNNHLSNNSYINNAICIGELNHTEKLTLFRKIINSQIKKENTTLSKAQDIEFLNYIPAYPLDVSIAAHYLKATGVSYDKYLECLRMNDEEFDNVQGEILKEAGEYIRTRYNIIALSLKNIIEANKDFKNLLIFISILNSQNIPKDILISYKNCAIVDSFIYYLKKYSLITDGISLCSNYTFTIHQSTQVISRNYLIRESNQKNNQVIQEITNVLNNYMKQIIDKEDNTRMKLMISHCETYLAHPRLLTGIKKGFIEGALGTAYFYLGANYLTAKKTLENNLKYLNIYEPENHSAIILTSGYLANVYRILGSHEKGQSLILEKLQSYKDYFSGNPVVKAWFLGWLGNIHRELGNYEKARTLFEEGLTIYKSYPIIHPNKKAWILAYLGLVYKDIGDLSMAKALLEESITIYDKSLSNTHSRTAWALVLLGSVYRMIGNYQKAENLIKNGIAICKDNFFETHEVRRSQTYELANLYIDIKKYDKAENLLVQSLKGYKEYYDNNNIAKAMVLMSLGRLFLLKGDRKLAKVYTKQALIILQQEGHPDKYKCMQILEDIAGSVPKSLIIDQDFKK
jgi:tetratricopeptide (TPR) repeat protein/DNA-binding CsgD family transcriptional regulator